MAETTPEKQHIAFIGLGAMGGPMAIRLVQAGFSVTGYDISAPAMHRLQSAGGHMAASAAAAAAGAAWLMIMVATAEQAESTLFGPDGALTTLPTGATVILCSTVPPAFVQNVAQRSFPPASGCVLSSISPSPPLPLSPSPRLPLCLTVV